jgi:hypothetical protein
MAKNNTINPIREFETAMVSHAGCCNRGTLEEDCTSNRLGWTEDAYSTNRPADSLPIKHHHIMMEMSRIYKTHGSVRNMIDLMSDFVSCGVRINHINPGIQQLLRNWAIRVNMAERSERIANSLFLYGQVFIERKTIDVDITFKQILRQSKADFDIDISEVEGLPVKYILQNPIIMDTLGYTGIGGTKKEWAIRIPETLREMINLEQTNMRFLDTHHENMFKMIPDSVKDALKENPDAIKVPFPNVDIIDYYFKKPDWELWATPIAYSILRQIRLLEKAQMADLTALDSAINHLRLWVLGSLDKNSEFLPGPEAFDAFKKLLKANAGAAVKDAVWGPGVQLIETQTDVSKIIGQDKYIPSYQEIYAGLGVPQTLTGSASGGGGTTNNLVSLKTLVNRLWYGRSILLDFWTRELEIISKKLDIRSSPEIEFDVMSFDDEAAIQKLWLDLADRNIISHERVRERFNVSTKIEEKRLNNEEKKRSKHRIPLKAGPFHNGEFEQQCLKILMENGKINPEDILNLKNIEYDEDGIPLNQVPVPESESEPDDNTTDKGGRPRGVRDSSPRRRRAFPVTRANKIKAKALFDAVGEALQPVFLKMFNKPNMRSLTSLEFKQAELIKADAFLKFEDFDALEMSKKEFGVQLIKNDRVKKLDSNIIKRYLEEVVVLANELDRDPTVEEKKDIVCDLWFGDKSL